MRQTALFAAATLVASAMLAAPASADNFGDMASYNHPYGMVAGQETQTPNPSLRDGNGNLTVVNGQFTSANFGQQSGVQSASAGVGGSSSSGNTLFGTASAVGNSLNVVTTGSNNTVIVNSSQTNSGNQTATVSINGK